MSDKVTKIDDQYIIPNVMISYPALAETAKYRGKDTNRYSITMLMHKESQKEIIDYLQERIDEVIEDGRPLESHLKPIRDGDLKGVKAYDGYMLMKANSQDPVIIADPMGNTVEDSLEIRSMFYNGVTVNAHVRFWWMSNENGRRVNCQLIGVQLVKRTPKINVSAVEYKSHFGKVEGAEESEPEYQEGVE